MKNRAVICQSRKTEETPHMVEIEHNRASIRPLGPPIGGIKDGGIL